MAGMRDIIKNAIKGGMPAVGNIKTDITYHVAVEGIVNDRNMPVLTYINHTIESTIVSYSNQEIVSGGGLIAPGDRKVIIENRFFTALSIVPKKSDQMTLDDSNVYKIVNPKVDPSHNVYFFQVRQVE